MPLEFPRVDQDLLDRLNEIFPDCLPKKLDYTDRDVAIAVGTRLVIGKMQDEFNRQNHLGPYKLVPVPKPGVRWGG